MRKDLCAAAGMGKQIKCRTTLASSSSPDLAYYDGNGTGTGQTVGDRDNSERRLLSLRDSRVTDAQRLLGREERSQAPRVALSSASSEASHGTKPER